MTANAISILKNMNPNNFLDATFNQDNREYVVRFRHSNIKLHSDYYIAHNCIYDGEEDFKICRIELTN